MFSLIIYGALRRKKQTIDSDKLNGWSCYGCGDELDRFDFETGEFIMNGPCLCKACKRDDVLGDLGIKSNKPKPKFTLFFLSKKIDKLQNYMLVGMVILLGIGIYVSMTFDSISVLMATNSFNCVYWIMDIKKNNIRAKKKTL